MNYQNVKKYPAYKDSGVEWIGEIPVGWKLKKMKYLFRDISIKNRPDEILLSVTQDQGVIPRGWLVNRPVMPTGNLETFKFIEKGNFAISLRSFEGGIEYCHHNGIISPAYTVLQINRELFELYYKYLFKSFSFISEIQTSVMGIREGKK
jgi:type I restriction enzyme S subunit